MAPPTHTPRVRTCAACMCTHTCTHTQPQPHLGRRRRPGLAAPWRPGAAAGCGRAWRRALARSLPAHNDTHRQCVSYGSRLGMGDQQASGGPPRRTPTQRTRCPGRAHSAHTAPRRRRPPRLGVRVPQRVLPLLLHRHHRPRVGIVVGPPHIQDLCMCVCGRQPGRKAGEVGTRAYAGSNKWAQVKAGGRDGLQGIQYSAASCPAPAGGSPEPHGAHPWCRSRAASAGAWPPWQTLRCCATGTCSKRRRQGDAGVRKSGTAGAAGAAGAAGTAGGTPA